MSVVGTRMTGVGIDTAGNTDVGMICSRGAMSGGGGGGGDLGGGEGGASGGGAGGDKSNGPETGCGSGAGTGTSAHSSCSPRLLRSLKSLLVRANQSSNLSTQCSRTSNCILRPLTSLSIASWLARRVFNKTVKLGIWTETSGPKSCKALASTCRLRRSLAGCLKFRRSRRSRRVWSRAEKKLKKTRAS